MSLLIVAGLPAVGVAVAAALVYRDAVRIGVDAGSPTAWALLVAATGATGVTTAVLVPDAPVPGVLVMVALGPLLYLLEREDTRHGDEPADPTRLPSAARRADEGGGESPSGDADGGNHDATASDR